MFIDFKPARGRSDKQTQSGRAPQYRSLLVSVLASLLLISCGENAATQTLPADTTVATSPFIAPTTLNSAPTVAATNAAPVLTTIPATTPTNSTPATTSASAPTVVSTTTPATANSRAFDRVFIIVLENADYSRAIVQPYLAKLAEQGTFLTGFYGVGHPSYPNYLAMIAGTTFGIQSDSQTDISKTSLVDLMETKSMSWKSYAQQYPGNSGCFKGVIQGNYVRKHMPFLSFTNVQNSPNLCSKIVPAEQLQKDLAAGTLPQYSMYVPDQNNDGHDTGVAFASKWLENFLTPLMKNPTFTRNTLVVVTFDEGDAGTSNQIYTLLLGDPVKAGVRNATKYNHYSLLRTIEDNFGLGTLGREDDKASPISGVWNSAVAH